jgi:hypothetical protein
MLSVVRVSQSMSTTPAMAAGVVADDAVVAGSRFDSSHAQGNYIAIAIGTTPISTLWRKFTDRAEAMVSVRSSWRCPGLFITPN